MKRFLAVILTLAMLCAMLAGCGGGSTASPSPSASAPAQSQTPDTPPEPSEPAVQLTGVQAIIAEAEGMTLEELAKKAIEESNGKMFYGVGNYSRGKSALPLFIEYLQSIDSSY